MFWSLLSYIVTKACASPRYSTWFTRPFLLGRGWGLGTRLPCSQATRRFYLLAVEKNWYPSSPTSSSSAMRTKSYSWCADDLPQLNVHPVVTVHQMAVVRFTILQFYQLNTEEDKRKSDLQMSIWVAAEGAQDFSCGKSHAQTTCAFKKLSSKESLILGTRLDES